MNKVVKCLTDTCGQHFMHTPEDTRCPFCHSEYIEIDDAVKKEIPKGAKETKKKIETLEPKKESFKMWSEG